jgi:hypothetical protein
LAELNTKVRGYKAQWFHFTEPSVSAFLVAVTFVVVVVYPLQRLVEHPSLGDLLSIRKVWFFADSLEAGRACSVVVFLRNLLARDTWYRFPAFSDRTASLKRIELLSFLR